MSHLKVVPCMMLRALLDLPNTSFLLSGLPILEILLWQRHCSPLPHVMLLGEQIWSLSMLWLTSKAWLEATDSPSWYKHMPMLALTLCYLVLDLHKHITPRISLQIPLKIYL